MKYFVHEKEPDLWKEICENYAKYKRNNLYSTVIYLLDNTNTHYIMNNNGDVIFIGSLEQTKIVFEKISKEE